MGIVAELKRRNVFRVGAAYLVISWLLLQVVDVVAPILEIPDWAPRLILLVIAIGFIPTLIFSWAFELTPEGVKRESDVDRGRSITRQTGRKLNYIIIGSLLFIIVVMFVERVWFVEPGSVDPPENLPSPAGEQAATLRAAASPDRDRSIAVLPFRNLDSGYENARFLSDGIHDDLLTRLAKIGDLKVISRTSVMAYRDTTKNMRQIGEELGVSSLLEGGVQRAGDRVRINVQLIDARTDEHLWAETYDREISVENIFDIQAEIARAIAGALRATLSIDVDESLSSVPTESLEAYQAVLMSRQFANRGSFEALDAAVKYAQQALELDPDYADGHLALALSLTHSIDAGAAVHEEVGGQIRRAIERAMMLKPDYGRVYSAQGYYLATTGQSGFDESFETAMRLEPGNADTMYEYGYALQRSARPEQALELLLRAGELDPLSQGVLFALARTYSMLGKYELARATLSRLRRIDPASPVGYATVAGTYNRQGDLVNALFWLRLCLTVDPQDFEVGGFILSTYDNLEDVVEAGLWSDWLAGWVTNQPQPLAMQAKHSYLLGDFDTAVQYSNLALRLNLPSRWGSDSIFMRIKRDEALANGTPEVGIGVLQSRHPELFENPLDIGPENAPQAVDLALLLKMVGRDDEARQLLHGVIGFYDQPYSTAGSKRTRLIPVKAEALALLDDEEAALAELRRIIDDGWRLGWRWKTELNYNFNGIRETPEFKAMIRELEQDISEQRRRARSRMEQGEIPPPPQPEIKPDKRISHGPV